MRWRFSAPFIRLNSLIILFLFIFSSGCGSDKPFSSGQKLEGIHFANGVSEHKKQLILKDLEFIGNIHLTPSNSSRHLQTILKLPDLSGSSFSNWIRHGFHIFLPQNFDTVRNTHSASFGGMEEPALPFSNLISGSAAFRTTQEPKISMINYGVDVYIQSKREGKVAWVDVDGVGTVYVETPFVGMMLEGEGLFGKNLSSGNPADIQYVIYRLATLLHEIRHNYGNSKNKTLGFQHVICPSGPYKDKPACDNNVNGPYIVAAFFIHSFLQSCQSWCSQPVLDSLKVLYTDYLDRIKLFFPDPHAILEKQSDPAIWDDTPEEARN